MKKDKKTNTETLGGRLKGYEASYESTIFDKRLKGYEACKTYDEKMEYFEQYEEFKMMKGINGHPDFPWYFKLQDILSEYPAVHDIIKGIKKDRKGIGVKKKKVLDEILELQKFKPHLFI